MKFGIDNSVRSTGNVGLLPNPAQQFQQVEILMPTFEMKEIQKVEKPVLYFHYKGANGQHNQMEFPIDYGAKNEEKNFGMLNSRIAHIYKTFAPLPEAGIGVIEGAEPTNEEEQLEMFNKYFQQIVADFQAIYDEKIKGKKAWLLIHYTKSGDVTTPTIPNFLELVKAGQPPVTLRVDKRYHPLIQPDVTRSPSTPGTPGGLPNMEGEEGFKIP